MWQNLDERVEEAADEEEQDMNGGDDGRFIYSKFSDYLQE